MATTGRNVRKSLSALKSAAHTAVWPVVKLPAKALRAVLMGVASMAIDMAKVFSQTGLKALVLGEKLILSILALLGATGFPGFHPELGAAADQSSSGSVIGALSKLLALLSRVSAHPTSSDAGADAVVDAETCHGN